MVLLKKTSYDVFDFSHNLFSCIAGPPLESKSFSTLPMPVTQLYLQTIKDEIQEKLEAMKEDPDRAQGERSTTEPPMYSVSFIHNQVKKYGTLRLDAF